MNEEYILKVKNKTINNKIHFNVKDIKNNIIDDYDSIINKLEISGYDVSYFLDDYIDLYSLILLIAFSNDYRAYKYKLYLISCTIVNIAEIHNPELCIDRSKSLYYKKGSFETYYYKGSNTIYNSFKDILLDEINTSSNIDSFRQII